MFMILVQYLVLISLWGEIVKCRVPRMDGLFFRSRDYTIKDELIRKSLEAGAHVALKECQNTFKWDKWNCPQVAFSRQNLQHLNKETAYIQAILAAGVMHTIIRNCTAQHLTNCGKCDLKLPERLEFPTKYQYGLEEDNNSDPAFDMQAHDASKMVWKLSQCQEEFVKFSEEIAINYLDESRGFLDLHNYIILHNHAMGRMAVKSTMKKHCKCNGISEDKCRTQTCWHEIADFLEIAQYLRKKYDNAAKVDLDNFASPVENMMEKYQTTMQTSKNLENLIYLEASPDYCSPNIPLQWDGTIGRICSRIQGENINFKEKRSCKTLCKSCGHRVRRRKREKRIRCSCTFKWCCEVHCKTCVQEINEFYCD